MLDVPARQDCPASKPLACCNLHTCNLSSRNVLLMFTQQPTSEKSLVRW
jgi:hypothetical protein